MDYEIFKNKKLVLAVSTGVDSMVLLNKVMKIDCEIFIVYVRHHHRERVHIENEFFIKYCEDNQLNLITYDYYHQNGNFESLARNYRYECFKEVYDKYNCDYLLTAHHGDDLVETILMRQLRGSDLNSIGGFREFSTRSEMKIARPLLEYSKQDLRMYADEHNIPYYEDETNADISYQRNYLRHEVIPKFGLHYIKRYVNFSREMYELSDFVNEVVDQYITVLNDIYLDVKVLDKRIIKYAVKKCLSYLYGDDIKNIFDKHVDLIVNMESGSKLQLPNKYFVFFTNSQYIFSKCIDEVYQYEYQAGLEVNFLNSKLVFGKGKKLYLDSSVVFPLRVVNADLKMKIKNKNGTQQLNRVFINAKVPSHKRKSWPILIDSNDEVICVFNIKYSKLCINDTPNVKYMIQYYCDFGGDDYNGK